MKPYFYDFLNIYNKNKKLIIDDKTTAIESPRRPICDPRRDNKISKEPILIIPENPTFVD